MRTPEASRELPSAPELLDSVADAFFTVDGDWRFTFINEPAEALLGAPEQHLLGEVVWEAFPDAIGTRLATALPRALVGRRREAFTEFHAPSGRWLAVQIVPHRTGLSVLVHDVSALKFAERRSARLAETQALLREVATAVAAGRPMASVFELLCERTARVFDAHSCWVVRFAEDGPSVVVGAAAPVGRPWMAVDDEAPERVGGRLAAVRETGKPLSGRTGGQLEHWGLLSVAVVPVRLFGQIWGALSIGWPDGDVDASETVSLLSDLAELAGMALGNMKAQATIERQALTDGLTGLRNLRSCQQRLDDGVARARRHRHPLTLALVDVDHFKDVNDGFGHIVGDRVLRAVAGALDGAGRDEDFAARIGGDEFALILDGTDAAAAMAVAEGVRERIAAISEPGLPPVTVSIGLCGWSDGQTREDLQRCADDALYWAKLHGRNAAAVHDPDVMEHAYGAQRAGSLRAGRRGSVPVPMDLGERAAHHVEIEAARDYLLAVTSSIASGLLSCDRDGVVTYANDAAALLLRRPLGDFHGLPLHAAVYGDAQPAENLPPLEGAVGAVYCDNDTFARGDGSSVQVSWTSTELPQGPYGDGRVVVFADNTTSMALEARLVREADAHRWAVRIRDALDANDFVVLAQPIVAAEGHGIQGHELLIRLRDERGGLVPPSDFLPAAEEHGLMADIDAWMIAQALAHAREGMPVHVNLSAQSLGGSRILDQLGEALGADPEIGPLLTIELTETALLASAEAGRAFAEALRRLGCRLALDDFGTGYNSFSRVKDLPIDELKIDTQFVRDLLTDAVSESVVTSMVSLANALGVRTVAEGVEDGPTADRLLAMGVTHLQGYHFGRPAPLAQPARR
jgi:diguanylate cyclase (GGDEF)-like protein/PAS domain S-box-containing protein